MKKLKMWIGNLDGRRQGLVIAATKARAIEIASVGRTDFNAHWRQLSDSVAAATLAHWADLRDDGAAYTLDPEVLYTRPYDDGIRGAKTWVQGRCTL